MAKSTTGEPEEPDHIVQIVKENLKTLRQKNGLSLDKLASRCGVSRAMLSQIEKGKSTPTISVLWKIAGGLQVPFSELLKEKKTGEVQIFRKENTKILYSNSQVFSSRALFSFSDNRKTEFYELELKPGGLEVAEPHQGGTTENIVVVIGKLRLRIKEQVYELDSRDAIFFKADVAHEYSNPGSEPTLMYLVMNYPEEIG